jgi:hypothetical protein
MADLPPIWKENCSKFPNILETECTNSRDARRKMVEHNTGAWEEEYDGVSFSIEYPNDGWEVSSSADFDVLFGFASSTNCKLALYVNDVKIHEDCRGMSLEDGLPTGFLFETGNPNNESGLSMTSHVKVVPDAPCTITCKALSLSNACINQLYKQSRTVVTKGTILKRLQVPGKPIGTYFTFKDADLNKCGVSQYYTDEHGTNQKKQVLWFRVVRAFRCEILRAVDTTDTWSCTIPEVCPGGEQIIRLRPTAADNILKRPNYNLKAITEEEAHSSPPSDRDEESDFSRWNASNLHEGIKFHDGMAFIDKDHPLVYFMNGMREEPLTEVDLFGDQDVFMCSAADVYILLDIMQSKMTKEAVSVNTLVGEMGNLKV